MDPMVTEILGVAGATIILLAFTLNQTSRLSNGSLRYDLLNVVGSLLLLLYAHLLGSIPFMILNLVWLAVSLKDVIVWFKRT